MVRLVYTGDRKLRLIKDSKRRLPKNFREVEYLESTGTQYIDTGLKGDLETKAELSYRYATTSSVSGSGRIFGSRTGPTSNGFAIGTYSGIIVLNDRVGAYFSNANIGEASTKVSTNIWYSVIISKDGAYFNGTKHTYANGSIVSFTTPNNLKLFGFDNNGTMGYGRVQISKCKIYKNDILVRDFIPCLDASNVPCMYELVEGKAYYNAGTGAFSYGHTITPVKYLESTGTQYIDTGVIPSNKKISAQVSFKLNGLSGTNTSGIIGSSKTDGSDNIQFSVYQSKWRLKLNNFGTYGNNYDTNNHIVKLNTESGTILDDTVLTSTQYTINSSNNIPMYLMGVSYNGTVYPSDDVYTLIGKIYYGKIWDNGVPVRDYIPVKDENNIGYMFDKVTHTLYANAGTGSFVVGSEYKDITRFLEGE